MLITHNMPPENNKNEYDIFPNWIIDRGMLIGDTKTGVYGDGLKDNTFAIQYLIDVAQLYGKQLYLPAGDYRIRKIYMKNLFLLGDPGTNIIHDPLDDESDAITITGLNAGRTKISNIMITGGEKGRDLIRIDKGDYVSLDNIYLINSKRDAVHVEQSATGYWIENMLFTNVKSQNAGRDGFNITIPNISGAFTNQTTMINCETRSATRQAIRLENLNNSNKDCKISCLKIINSELAVKGGTAEPIVLIKGSDSNGLIENISIRDSVVEDTTSTRTGYGIEISGKVSGLFEYENSIIHGAKAGDILGMELFPHYHVRNIVSSAQVSLYTSESGIYKKFRTNTLQPNGGYEDTYEVVKGDVIKGFVLDRYNVGNWCGEFTLFNDNNLFVNNLNNIDIQLINGKIRLINKDATTGTPLELFIQRVVNDTAY